MLAGATAGMKRPAIGRAKVDIARDHVRRVNPWSAIAAIAADLADVTPGLFTALNVAAVTVDTDHARYLAARHLLAAGVPSVDAGVRADLWLARATVCAPATGGACLIDGWTAEHLARAGEDVGMPCLGIETGDGFPSTLVMGQAGGALAAREVLALAGVTAEAVHAGEELRLDLRNRRLDRFRLDPNPRCAADHALASGRVAWLPIDPEDVALDELMRECEVTDDTSLVFGAAEIVATAVCQLCVHVVAVYCAARRPLGECPICGGPLAAARRVRRVRWADAAAAHRRPASAWFRPGDVFAAEAAGAVRVFGFDPPAIAWEAGMPWDDAAGRTRFSRLPKELDLARIRETRLGLIGLGHLGAALLQQLAPLPWKAILLLDRDTLAEHNRQAYPLAVVEGVPA